MFRLRCEPTPLLPKWSRAYLHKIRWSDELSQSYHLAVGRGSRFHVTSVEMFLQTDRQTDEHA